MTEKRSKIRRLRKGRCTIVLLLLMLFAMLLAGWLPKATAADEGRPMQTIIVAPGDTLWSLIQKHYDYQGDIRRAIYEVKQINELQEAMIVPGQTLLIPVR